MPNSIPIFYSIDENCYELTIVSMVSILKNTKSKIDFYILYSDLNQGIKLLISTVKKYGNCDIHFIEVDEKRFDGFPIASWVKLPAWYRIIIPEIVSFDKVIYLDCDTLVRGDIKEFYDIDITNHIIAGVSDITGLNNRTKRLKLKYREYINSGILLINCNLWNSSDIFNKILFLLNETDITLTASDQDAINYAANGKIKLVSQRYNYIENWWMNGFHQYQNEEKAEYLNARVNPLIVHFAGYNPNNPRCENTFRDEWFKYAKLTNIYTKILEKYIDEMRYTFYNDNFNFFKATEKDYWNLAKKNLIFIETESLTKDACKKFQKFTYLPDWEPIFFIDNTEKHYKVNNGIVMIQSSSGIYKALLYDRNVLNQLFKDKFANYTSSAVFFENNPELKFSCVKNFLNNYDLYCDFTNLDKNNFTKEKEILLKTKPNVNTYIVKNPHKSKVPLILSNNSIK